GIATRAFERKFQLADHVRVSGASHADGMLHIDLVREVPEALKPRRIEILSGDTVEKDVVEAKAVN
ncbi:MAG: Hsp20 family protein, partial [Pseudomonadota bacterium]